MIISKCIEPNILCTYKGVYDSGKRLPLVLMLVWEQLIFLVLGNSYLRKLLLAQYDCTVLP